MDNNSIASFFTAILDKKNEKKIINMLYLGYTNEQILEELINTWEEGDEAD
jgi:hypothetical protein